MANKKRIEDTTVSEETVVSEPKKVEKNIGTVQSAEMRRRLLAKRYSQEEKISVSIAPMYRDYLGNVARISVNGIMVTVPCDGRSYKIPKTHAEALFDSIQRINDRLTRKDRMKNIVNNVERAPGDIKFFG